MGCRMQNKKFKIISKTKCTKKFLFHSSSKKLTELGPKFCKKVEDVYEYEKPTIHAFDKITNEYCFEPIGKYKKILKSGISWAHHKLKFKNRVIFLGTKLKGYIYVLDGSQFYKIVRKDFECGRWRKSIEWVSYKKLKPIKKIEVIKPIDIENIKEYEFLGKEYVGLMDSEDYLKLVKDKKVAKAIKIKLKENFKPWIPKGLEKFK